MLCPCCTVVQPDGGPYRGRPSGERVSLEQQTHPSGIRFDRCPTCAGVFFEHGALGRFENALRRAAPSRRVGHDNARDLLRRAYENAHRPGDTRERRASPDCPACEGIMMPREWGIGSLVFVDVCLECRGIWLDSGELEALERLFGGGR